MQLYEYIQWQILHILPRTVNDHVAGNEVVGTYMGNGLICFLLNFSGATGKEKK